MTRSGSTSPVLLLACAGLIAIALMSPAAGQMGRSNMMGQGMMGQGTGEGDMMAACPDNMTCMRMQSMMTQCPANATCVVMEPMTGPCPPNRTCVSVRPMMPCPQGMTCMMMRPMMGACPENGDCMMMEQTMGSCPQGKTCYSVRQLDNASTAQARLDCARSWLEKAMKLHDLHLRDPTSTTEESQLELMDQITHAYECISGENVTMGLINASLGKPSADEHGH